MSKVSLSSKIEFEVTLKLTEEEAKALNTIVGYGPDKFVEWFYKNLGQAYLKPHEQGMRSLFETARRELAYPISTIDRVKKAWEEHEIREKV